jgi:hypothetical protein
VVYKSWDAKQITLTTPWNRVILEKLVTSQLATKFPSPFDHRRVEHSPQEAYSHSASQEIPHLLCNPNVHYRVHNSPPMDPALSRMNPVHLRFIPQVVCSLQPYRTKLFMHFSRAMLHVPPILIFDLRPFVFNVDAANMNAFVMQRTIFETFLVLNN